MNITIEGYMNVGKKEFCNELSSLLYYETSDGISFDDNMICLIDILETILSLVKSEDI